MIPSVDVPVTSLDFGPIGVGNESTLNIPVINDGAGPLAGEVVISNLVLVGSDAFSSTEDLSTPVVVNVGQTFEIPIAFAPEMLGVENATVTFETNVDPFLVEVTLTGLGTDPPVIDVNPLEVAVEVEVGETASRTITISNSGPAALSFDLSSTITTPETSMVAASMPETSLALKTGNALKASGQPAARSKEFLSIGSLSSTTPAALTNVNDFVYQIDDGSSENSVGLTSESDLLWLNEFNTQSGAAVITTIAATVAEGPEETAATFLLYEDPDDDGDPSNAVLLQAVEGVITNPGTDIFSSVAIPPTEVSGVFFVGVTITAPGFPVPLDENSGSQRASWIAGGDPGTMDINDLTNNGLPIELLDNLDFPANLLVRADGQFFSFSPQSGSVAQGESVDVQLDFFPNAPGLFTADLIVANNDPSQTEIAVPISMAVEGVSVVAVPDSFDIGLPQGATSTEVLTLQNENNNSAVDFSIEVESASSTASAVGVTTNQLARIEPKVRTAAYNGPAYDLLSTSYFLAGEESVNAGVPQYTTGFEDFAPGDIDGQQGWLGQFGNWTIEGSNPFEGAQHFRGLADGLGATLAEAPSVPFGTDPISSLSAYLNIQGTGVSWLIQPGSPTNNLITTRIFFQPNGAIEVLENDGAGGVILTPTGINYPSGYFRLDLEVERSTALFTLSINGEEVLTG
ncbi:MAG: choice-of-anchor D domain-containing protein, partial [Bacteroidota bacterium]